MFDESRSSLVPRPLVRDVFEGEIWDDVEVGPSACYFRRVELRLDPTSLLRVPGNSDANQMGSQRMCDIPQSSRVPRLLVRDGCEGEVWDDVEVVPPILDL